MKFEAKWSSIRKNIPSCNVTIDTDRIFEYHWVQSSGKKAPLNMWHTHLCCCEARCSSCGSFMFPVLLNRGVRFTYLYELCEEWLVSVKCGQQQRKQLGQVEISCSTWDDCLKLYFIRQNADYSCHPNSHCIALCNLQSTCL